MHKQKESVYLYEREREREKGASAMRDFGGERSGGVVADDRRFRQWTGVYESGV